MRFIKKGYSLHFSKKTTSLRPIDAINSTINNTPALINFHVSVAVQVFRRIELQYHIENDLSFVCTTSLLLCKRPFHENPLFQVCCQPI